MKSNITCVCNRKFSKSKRLSKELEELNGSF